MTRYLTRRFRRRLSVSDGGFDNNTTGLGAAAEFFWRRGRDTVQITRTLRRKGWDVTEAGVANALAWRRDIRVPAAWGELQEVRAAQ